ncbi:MAG: CapA family protein [Nocardioidaceae bacterium]
MWAVATLLALAGCTSVETSDAEEPMTESTDVRTSPPLTAEPTSPPVSPPPPAPPDPPAVFTVTFVGDIMLGRSVGQAAAAAGDPSAPLRPMAKRLRRADITVGNLESTLSDDGAPRQGDDSFAAPPTVLGGLASAGFDVLSVANNHTGDYGRRALIETVRAFAGSGIEPVGAGANRREAWRPVVVALEDVSVGFLAFNAIGETWRASSHSAGAASLRMDPRTGPLDPVALASLADRVRRLAARTDVTIVLPHWGDQYTHEPVPDQRLVGARLLDAGATVVVGGHAHWVQSVQRHEGRFVVHSLGNFVFDMDFMRETQEGFVLDLSFRDGELVGTRATPYVIGPDFAPRPARGVRARAILGDVEGLGLLP